MGGQQRLNGLDIGGGSRLHRQFHACGPATFSIADNLPMRFDGDRLMYQFETCFRLADGLDGIGKNASSLIEIQFDIQAQPGIGKFQLLNILEIQNRPQIAKLVALRIAEKSVILTIGQPGKIKLDAKMKRPVGGKSFDQVGNFQRIAAGVERDAFGDFQWNSPGISLLGQLNLNPIGIASDPGGVDTIGKIAAFFGTAFLNGECINIFVAEMINQAVAQPVSY